MSTSELVIVGAGISGLSAAFYAIRHGLRPTLVENSTRPGGLIRTDVVQGCTLEAGPDSFIASKPAVAELARELGIEDQLIGSNDAERRIFIARDGRLVAMPPGMIMMIPTDLNAVEGSPLFNNETRLLIRAEERMPPAQRSEDFSVGDLVRAHFGEEVLSYIAEPLLSGVYGGDPSCLSAQSVLPRFVQYERDYGSLVRGAREESRAASNGSLFRSFAHGMGQLVSALDGNVRPHAEFIHDEACSLRRNANGRYLLRCAGSEIESERVILTVPAYRAADVLSSLDPDLASDLAAIPYSSAILGTFLFERKTFTHSLNGFGFLVPRPERKTIAAATWINTKFPSRIADGYVALRAFTVDPEAEALADSPDMEVSASMYQDLCRFMGDLGTPLYTDIYRWPASMPQYIVGHERRIASIRARLAHHRGISLVSNYLDGIGIPDCVRNAAQAF